MLIEKVQTRQKSKKNDDMTIFLLGSILKLVGAIIDRCVQRIGVGLCDTGHGEQRAAGCGGRGDRLRRSCMTGVRLLERGL